MDVSRCSEKIHRTLNTTDDFLKSVLTHTQFIHLIEMTILTNQHGTPQFAQANICIYRKIL